MEKGQRWWELGGGGEERGTEIGIQERNKGRRGTGRQEEEEKEME